MKFSEEAMKLAFDHYMTEPIWRHLYDHAPEGAKRRLRVAFWGGRYLDEREDLDAYRAYREKVESEMTYEDAAYLAEFFPREPGQKHYTELRDEIQFKSLKTVEKLDEAIDIMTEGFSARERKAIEKSRTAFKKCDDPCVDYEWLWKAVGGDGDRCCMVGDIFDHGHGVEPDEALAFFWFKKGALSGDGDCCYRLAHLYENPESPRFDMERTLFWFREGLRRKNFDCKCELAERLTTSENPAWKPYKNAELGVALLRGSLKDDKEGDVHYYLARCYEQGVGVAKDTDRAIDLYETAKDRGCYWAEDDIKRLKGA